MRNFTYRSEEEKENIEEILRQRKRKLNRQQLIAGAILGVILVILGLYAARQVYYTEFDGFIHVDANQVRTPFDIFLDSLYVETGDVIVPGDTLYSYYSMDLMVRHADITSEPDIFARYRDLTLRYNSILQEIEVLKVRISELRKQISLESHNIQFGLSDNSHKMDLERLLTESLAQLKALQNELAMVGGMRGSLSPAIRQQAHSSGYDHEQQIYDDIRSKSLKETMRFRLATDSAIVVNIMAPDRMVFFQKESIMTLQHLKLMDNNLHVIAYIPVDKINNITYNSNAEVVVNENLSFSAHVSVIGMRTEVIPENLRSYFTKKNTALIANLEIDYDQTIPFWSVAPGLPVVVRIKNIETWRSDAKSNYIWVTTGEGVNHKSLELFMRRKRHHSVLEREADAPFEVYSQPNTVPADSVNESRTVKTDTDTAATAAAPKAPQPVKVGRTNKDDYAFDIIVNVYSKEENANNRINALKSMGFKDAAKILRSEKWYISIDRFATRSEAEAAVEKLKSQSREYREAWILDSRKQP